MALSIRQGNDGEDSLDFGRLMLLSAPSFLPATFGEGVCGLMQALFRRRNNLFSFDSTVFADADGVTAGMLLAYGAAGRAVRELHTGAALVSGLQWRLPLMLPRLLRAGSAVGSVPKDCYYVSNLAVYPQFRGLGAGTALLRHAEEQATSLTCRAIVLDVETDNSSAIRLYSRLGYEQTPRVKGLRLGSRVFAFHRMIKPL